MNFETNTGCPLPKSQSEIKEAITILGWENRPMMALLSQDENGFNAEIDGPAIAAERPQWLIDVIENGGSYLSQEEFNSRLEQAALEGHRLPPAGPIFIGGWATMGELVEALLANKVSFRWVG